MCKHEIVGDYYRGCGHFHGRYFTGEIKDCGSPCCKTSCAHKHKTGQCECQKIILEDRRVQNLFHNHFPDCERTYAR